MNNKFNVIYNDEYAYGFLKDLIKMLQSDEKIAKETGDDIEPFEDAIEEAETLLDEDDDYYIYCMYWNPMGAFVFTKLIEEK